MHAALKQAYIYILYAAHTLCQKYLWILRTAAVKGPDVVRDPSWLRCFRETDKRLYILSVGHPLLLTYVELHSKFAVGVAVLCRQFCPCSIIHIGPALASVVRSKLSTMPRKNDETIFIVLSLPLSLPKNFLFYMDQLSHGGVCSLSAFLMVQPPDRTSGTLPPTMTTALPTPDGVSLALPVGRDFEVDMLVLWYTGG